MKDENLKFGLRLYSDIGQANKLKRIATIAEKQGFEYCWCSHDLFKRSAWVILTAIATSTSRIKIGPCVVNPITTNPAEIAMMISTLDELSENRAILGIGAGAPGFMEWVGEKSQDPYNVTRESVILIKKLIQGEQIEFNGKEFSWKKESYMRFKNRQDLPIYIGGQRKRMLQLMGELGDGALPTIFPPEYIDYAISHIEKGAKKAGRKIEDIEIVACTWFSIDKDGSIAEDRIKELIAYYGQHLSPLLLKEIGLKPEDFSLINEALRTDGINEAKKLVTDKMFRLAIIGTPDECIQQIEKLKNKGVNQIGIGGALGPNPENAIELIGKTIIPYFKNN